MNLRKKICIYSGIVLSSFWLLAGCGNNEEADKITETGSWKEALELQKVTEQNIEKEPQETKKIIWQKSFQTDSGEEFCVLIHEILLEKEKRIFTSYEILLQDREKKILQKISDETFINEIQENKKIQFEDFDMDWHEDLLIGNILYLWKPDDNVFAENAIVVPAGEVIDEWGRSFFIVNENEDKVEESRCEINSDKSEVVKLRTWILDKKESALQIIDCLEEKVLFETPVTFEEDGQLIFEEYYRNLFSHNVYSINVKRDIPNGVIRTTVPDKKSYIEVHEYADKEELLAAYGFEDATPFYQYYDVFGDLWMELYFDENTGIGCGIVYSYWYTKNVEKVTEIEAFVFDNYEKAEWEEKDLFSLKLVDGSDGRNYVEDFEETIEYTKDGKVDYYKSQGYVDWLYEDGSTEKLLEIDFVYRPDGTLAYRNYSHNSMVFFTSSCSITSVYDESGRLVYERSYITHGSIERYYIYGDDSSKPLYYLGLDYNLGAIIPQMVKCE